MIWRFFILNIQLSPENENFTSNEHCFVLHGCSNAFSYREKCNNNFYDVRFVEFPVSFCLL